MRNIIQIISNTLRSTFRKKENIIIYIFLPLLGVLLSLVIYGTPSSPVLRVGFVNHDNGIICEDLKEVLSSNDGFQLIRCGICRCQQLAAGHEYRFGSYYSARF